MEWPRVRLGDMLSLEYGKSLPAHARDPHGEFPVAGSNGPDGKYTTQRICLFTWDRSRSEGIRWEGLSGTSTTSGPIDTTNYVVPKLSA